MKPALEHAATEPSVPSNLHVPRARILPAEALQLIEHARQLEQQAKREAERIIAEARAQSERIHRQSLAQAREQVAVESAAERLKAEKQLSLAGQEQLERIVDVARLLAERVVRRTLEQDPATLLELAKDALDKFRRARETRLLVHPSQVDRLRELLPSLGFPPGAISAHGDSNLDVGDLRIVSDLGELTFSVARQLDRLVQALR